MSPEKGRRTEDLRMPAGRSPARTTSLLFAGVLGIAVLARLAGLSWGLPDRHRYYPYHPDEPVLAMAVWQVNFAALQLSPHFFNYGSLTIYLDRIAVDAASRFGWIRPAVRTPEPASFPMRSSPRPLGLRSR